MLAKPPAERQRILPSASDNTLDVDQGRGLKVTKLRQGGGEARTSGCSVKHLGERGAKRRATGCSAPPSPDQKQNSRARLPTPLQQKTPKHRPPADKQPRHQIGRAITGWMGRSSNHKKKHAHLRSSRKASSRMHVPGRVDEDVGGVVAVEPREHHELQERPPEGGDHREEVALEEDLPPGNEDDLVRVHQDVAPCEASVVCRGEGATRIIAGGVSTAVAKAGHVLHRQLVGGFSKLRQAFSLKRAIDDGNTCECTRRSMGKPCAAAAAVVVASSFSAVFGDVEASTHNRCSGSEACSRTTPPSTNTNSS